MNTRNLTYEILNQECVGDSLGKHNFNFLSLDSALCNLSSLFLTTTNQNVPLFSVFYDLSTNKNIYDDNLKQMLDPFLFERTYNGIFLLSSYWMNQELTTEYEFNKSKIGNNLEDFFIKTNTPTFISELTSRGLDYVEENYPAVNFIEDAKINLVTPIYENDGSIIKKFEYDVLEKSVVVRKSSEELPIYENIKSSKPKQEYRKIDGYFFKKDSNFGIVPILKYVNKNNNWSFVNILSTFCPEVKVPTISESTIIQNYNTVNTKTKQISLDVCSPILFNQWYSRDVYGHAIATCNGKPPNNYGTLTVIFEKSPTESLSYSWTAKSENADDTYLEWNDGVIKASNGHPSPKTVAKTWPMPYQNMKNIRFMFKKDSKALNYNVCASKRIFANV
jgi:hypothetical protein